MMDVAMHLSHSVAPETLAAGGEERLIQSYLDALHKCRSEATADVTPYPLEMAHKHYKLAVLDYARFVISRFWSTSTSPESFAAKASTPNTTMVNRNVEAAFRFIERVDRYLSEFEQERADCK